MIDLNYAARHVGALWKMIWAKSGWENEIDRSVDGVFRSFQAMLFAAPLLVAGVISVRQAATHLPKFQAAPLIEAPLLLAIGMEIFSFYLYWVGGLAALLLTARALGKSRRATDIVIAFNWAQPLFLAAQTAPLLLLGLSDSGVAAGFLSLPAVALMFLIPWAVVRRGVGLRLGPAIALIAALILINVVANSLVNLLASAFYKSA